MSYKQAIFQPTISVFCGILQLFFNHNDGKAQPSTTPKSVIVDCKALKINPPRHDRNGTYAQGFDLKSSSATGITFTNRLNTDLNPKSFDLLNGSGVTLGDYDGDGWCDVFLVAMSGKNKLFRNLGDWKFEETTVKAGLNQPIPYSSGAVFEDINGDGWLDLIISTFGSGVRTYLNAGNGRFEPFKNPKLESPFGSATLALADVEGDGDLDLYVTNYGLHTMRTKLDLRVRTVRGKPQVVGRYRDYYKIIDGKLVEYGEPDSVFLNNGQGIFEPVAWSKGSFLTEEGQPLLQDYRDLGLSAMFRDINQDGLPDIYVCNDFQTPDRVWINQGSGQFQALKRSAIKVSSYSSMGVDFGDLNRDGRDDFMVVEMLSRTHRLRMTQHLESAPSIQTTGEQTWDRPQISRNTLYVNESDGRFAEIAQYAGLSATEWSWAPVFLDVDLDGYEDVLIGNGHAQDNLDKDTLQRRSQFPNDSPQQLAIKFPPLKTPNLAFRNMGHMRFEEMGNDWGFESEQVSNAIALGDLDNDGDQDVVINCLDAPALVYENMGTQARIAIRLKGRPGNIRGIGARISLIENEFTQSQEIVSGGRYLSGDQAQRTFAVTNPNKDRRLEVRWRSGLQSIVEDVKANHLYEIHEPSSSDINKAGNPPQTQIPTLFQELPSIQRPHHSKAGPDSRQIQPTWPENRSTPDSALAWVDIDSDGDEDLVVSGGSQSSLLFQNKGNGDFEKPIQRKETFARLSDTNFASFPFSDASGLLVTPRQQSPDRPNTLIRWMPDGSEKIISKLPAGQYGPLAIADMDNDGDLDIFIGGQSPWGKFPVSSDSLLLRNDQGNLVIDAINAKVISSLHNVRGAIFCDWDLDGDSDLITTSEWGGINWLINEKGIFNNHTKTISPKKLKGLWQGLASGDFNEDERPDLIVCNMGQNTQWSQWEADQFRIYYSTKIREPETIVVRSFFNKDQWLPITPLEELFTWMPEAKTRFANHADYASKNTGEILGKHLNQFNHFEINTLETTMLLNLPDGIKKVEVPSEIQWAPCFSPAVADFNNDGHEDVFLSQNLDPENLQWGRMDTGHGLLLLGDGKGKLMPVAPSESGIRMKGEQRGSAFADFNHDGKMDLAVLERGEGVHVFVNQNESAGVTISLEGPAGNPHCIGAKLQKVNPQTGNVFGPGKEVQSGSGYQSLNSFKHIFAHQELPFQIQVTWPNGKVITHSISTGDTQVTIKQR
jgi:hypothetical protein